MRALLATLLCCACSEPAPGTADGGVDAMAADVRFSQSDGGRDSPTGPDAAMDGFQLDTPERVDAGEDATQVAVACTLHVRHGGSRDASGSEADPIGTVQDAADRVQVGDTVCVHGQGFESERVTIERDGEPDNRVVFRATDRAVLRGADIRADFVSFEGFEVTSDGEDVGSGILLEGEGIVVHDNHVHHTGIYGIACEGNGAGEVARVLRSTINGNTVSYIEGIGIWIEGAENDVLRNDVSRSFSHGSQDADGMRVFGSGHRIAENYIHDIYESDSTSDPHSDCIQSYNQGGQSRLENLVIENNVCSTDRHCVIISNTLGEAPMTNLVIRGNVCHSRIGSNGFYVGHESGQDDSIDGLVISNNVIHPEEGFFGIYSDNARNVTIRNNVILGSSVAWQGEAMEAGRGFVEASNVFDAPGIFEQPDDEDARIRYRPRRGSVLIDGGSNEGLGATFDLLGNERIQDGDGDGDAVVDVGPYELPPE